MNPASFFRANRQHMIQVRHIKKVSNWFNYKLKVEMNGYPQEEILISREKAATFKKWLDKYRLACSKFIDDINDLLQCPTQDFIRLNWLPLEIFWGATHKK